MESGTIILTLFPFTHLSSAKKRPAVVLSKPSKHKADVIVAFISSVIPIQLSETDLLFETERKDFADSGLKKKSVFKLDKLATLDRSIFSGELGTVNADTLITMEKRLKIALDLNKKGD